MFDDAGLIEALLGELRYVLDTNDIRDSEKNSAELRRRAAMRLGFADYSDYCAGIDQRFPPAKSESSQ